MVGQKAQQRIMVAGPFLCLKGKYDMARFRQWLNEDRAPIQFLSWASDGRVAVNIRGQRYVYITDAIFHDRWQRQARHQPGKVLNQILAMVRSGSARQIEPEPTQTTPTAPAQTIQPTLF